MAITQQTWKRKKRKKNKVMPDLVEFSFGQIFGFGKKKVRKVEFVKLFFHQFLSF
jgi:hypothetical protein